MLDSRGPTREMRWIFGCVSWLVVGEGMERDVHIHHRLAFLRCMSEIESGPMIDRAKGIELQGVLLYSIVFHAKREPEYGQSIS